MSDKAYSMDVGGKLLVVAAGNRKIDMINLNSPGEIAKVSDVVFVADRIALTLRQ